MGSVRGISSIPFFRVNRFFMLKPRTTLAPCPALLFRGLWVSGSQSMSFGVLQQSPGSIASDHTSLEKGAERTEQVLGGEQVW